MNETETSERVGAAQRRFLVFHAAGRSYALPAEDILEVIRVPSAARVPQSPSALLGVANLRGAVLPLVSLRALLRVEQADGADAARAIVLDGGAPVAVTVDAVEALITVESSRIGTRPVEFGAERGERLKGVIRPGEAGRAVKILDVQALLAEVFAERVAQRQRTSAVVAGTRNAADAAPRRTTLVTFEVAGQEFALPLGSVQGIVPAPESIAAMPLAESALGIMALRDELLPLLALRELLGFAPEPGSTGREKVVIASIGGARIGLVVDRARAIVSADIALIDPVPSILAARTGGEARIKAIYRGDDGRRLISILSPEQLFREDVMQRLGSERHGSSSAAGGGGALQLRTFLLFRLAGDEFGLPIEAVNEVAPMPDRITRVPKTPNFLEGVINLRGEIVPVVDQRSRFDMPKLERQESRRLIIVRTDRHRAGLIVDSVSQVLRTTADAIGPPPDLTGDITRLVLGVINLEEEKRIVLLLDPSELLTRAEYSLLDAFKRKAQGAS